MAGMLAALGEVLTIGNVVSEHGGDAKKLLEVIEGHDVQLLRTDGSMLKLLNNYIVEPVAVVSKDLKEDEIIDKVLGLHTDMFAGFYMQAYSILTNIYGKTTSVAVDVLGTDNGGLERVFLRGAGLALEDRDFLGEMMSENFNLSAEVGANVDDPENSVVNTVSAYSDDSDGEIKKLYKHLPGTEVGLHKGYKDLYIPNAIQRTIEVTVTLPATQNDKIGTSAVSITIPITIKTHVIYTSVENIINVLHPNSDDKGFFNRLDEYRAGAISLADLAFTGDLIKKYKDNKIKDKDGLLELVQARKLSASSKIGSRGTTFVGFEKYYNMYIISAHDKVVIEKHLKGKLSKGSVKQKFLDQAYGLSLTIMDQDYERVQILLRDIRGKTDLTYKSVSKTDKNGSDMEEITKALLANKAPVF